MTESSEALKMLKNLKVWEDVERASKRRHRGGRGSIRGSPQKQSVSALLVVEKKQGAERAFRNFSGVKVVDVASLNVCDLAPGTHPGRLTIWTQSAIKSLRYDSEVLRVDEAAPHTKSSSTRSCPKTQSHCLNPRTRLPSSSTIRSDKHDIKRAIQEFYEVRVKEVNTTTPEGEKKAFVKLTPDFKAADLSRPPWYTLSRATTLISASSKQISKCELCHDNSHIAVIPSMSCNKCPWTNSSASSPPDRRRSLTRGLTADQRILMELIRSSSR